VDYCFSGDGVATTVCSIDRGEMKNWPGFEFVRWVFFPWVVSTKIRWDWCYLFWIVAESWWSWTNAHQVLEVLSPKRSPVCEHFVFLLTDTSPDPLFFQLSAGFSSTSHLLLSFLECTRNIYRSFYKAIFKSIEFVCYTWPRSYIYNNNNNNKLAWPKFKWIWLQHQTRSLGYEFGYKVVL
jgi:hypothetical protein